MAGAKTLPANAGDTEDPGWILELERCSGGRNGNPLQCSCLENPRDRGAWWAAAYGVTQGRTRLKRLSSSSIISHLPLFETPWTVPHQVPLFI